MQLWEIFIIGVALSMDAVAVGMSDGMAEPRMRCGKIFAVSGAFALAQFLMPLAGYYCGAAFAELVARIAPWLSFALLSFIGGKMILDGVREAAARRKRGRTLRSLPGGIGIGGVLLQAVATSIDALAVGVAFVAAEATGGLPCPAALCALLIGATTFSLSAAAVVLGKKAGDRFSDGAELAGGAVLVFIGIKLLAEGLL